MDNHVHKQKVKASFDLASAGYDCPSLRFFASSADHLIDELALKGDEHFLDIATGTGHVALAAAEKLDRGRVTALDISEKMLQIAREKAQRKNLDNITIKCADIEEMGFADNSFDVAACAFGIFFLPDMQNGLRCIYRVLKPGGKFALTSFKSTLMAPLSGMLKDRLKKYGVEIPPQSWEQLNTQDKIVGLLKGVGFQNISVHSRQLGYYLQDSREWQEVLWNSGYRGWLSRLADDELQRFLSEHLEEVTGVAESNGLWLNVEVLFAIANSDHH